MKKYIAKPLFEAEVRAKDVPALLDKAGIGFEKISEANWSTEFPYTPQVQFRLAYSGNHLLLHYQVEEDSVRAVAPTDNGRVWEDSCCEFFVSPVADNTYYNIECNCATRLLIGFGDSREGRIHAPEEVLRKVDRWSSLGHEPFEEKVGRCSWQLALVIPVDVFFRHTELSLKGKTLRANFYKCGDKLQQMHFLSWNPIDVPKPDFHRPDFFGEVTFQ